MTQEELKAFTTSIMENVGDQATISEVVANIIEEFAKDDTERTGALAKVTALEAEKAKLLEKNMNLYLKVGNKDDSQPDKPYKQEENKRTYESLFDENGNLK